MMYPKKYRQPRKNNSQNVHSRFGRATLFLKQGNESNKENLSAKLSRKWRESRFYIVVMMIFCTIWAWDLYILPKIAEHKLKNPNNIKNGCITYLYYQKVRPQEKVYFLLNNEKKVSDSDIIPSSLVVDFPSNNGYRRLRQEIIKEKNTSYCRPIEYIELILWGSDRYVIGGKPLAPCEYPIKSTHKPTNHPISQNAKNRAKIIRNLVILRDFCHETIRELSGMITGVSRNPKDTCRKSQIRGFPCRVNLVFPTDTVLCYR